MKKISLSPFYVLVLLLQMSFVILYFAVPHFWILQIFSVLPPFFFFLPGLFFLLISFFKREVISILLAFSLCIFGFLFVDFNPYIFSKISIEDSQKTFVVFNSNTTLWNQEHPEEYMKFLKSQNADLYQLQEVIPPREKGQANTAIFKKYFPEYTIFANHELVTLSRLPIKSEKYIEGNDFQRVTLAINEQDVDFYNVHMRIHLLPELVRKPEEFMKEMRDRYYWRAGQFDQLLSQVKESSTAYISGDFNTSKTMGMMRSLQEITQDSFSKNGDIFPITWNMKDQTKWWRIDYNLVKGIRLLKHENIEQAEYSDHRAQRVEVVF